MKPVVQYDEAANAACIRSSTEKVLESEEVSEGIVLDSDSEGRIVGMEVPDAGRKLPPATLIGAAQDFSGRGGRGEIAAAMTRARCLRMPRPPHRDEGLPGGGSCRSAAAPRPVSVARKGGGAAVVQAASSRARTASDGVRGMRFGSPFAAEDSATLPRPAHHFCARAPARRTLRSPSPAVTWLSCGRGRRSDASGWMDGSMDRRSALSALSCLGQETRLEIFRLLVRAGPGGVPAGEIAARLGGVQNTVSAHLGVLAGAGLARAERDGRVVRYAAEMTGFRDLLAYLMEDCCDGAPELCRPAIEAVTCRC